jgi:signal transduction histidine kinase
MMNNLTVGRRLFWSVLSLFTIFAVLFIAFHQVRENEYKINTLNLKLQDYNVRMHETLHNTGMLDDRKLEQYVSMHDVPGLRVTMMTRSGRVFFDSSTKDYNNMENHINRPEVRDAIKNGSGYDINRKSSIKEGDHFYSATYFKEDGYIIRSALPYDNDLTDSLQADMHYIWFTVIMVALLTFVLYRFISRLDDNITKLRIFARRADHNESLDTEDLIEFPADELGEISEHIIKIYKRLQHTKEEQNVLKRQLTQNIAHELKTPVASIQGYLETIIGNPEMNEDTKKQFLDRCYAQSQRLASLLTDISTLNRLDDAPELMPFEDVDIAKTVTQIMKETALEMEHRRMAFDNRLPATLVVHGNPSMIYSIFRNLTDNAISYAGEGTTITLTARADMDRWHFTFSDNGVGVPYEHLGRLFERFYRVDKGRSRKLGGTGLGLAIVKNAVILHGGTISAANNIEGGLRFEFTIKKTNKS